MAMSDKGHDYTESSADRGSTQLATAQLHPARPCLPAASVPLSGPPSAGPAARRPSCSRPGCPSRRDGGPGTRPTIGQVMPAGSFHARICGVSGFLQSFRTSPACSCPPRPSDARPPRPGSRCGRRSPGPRSAEAPGCAWSTPRRPGPAGRRPPATRRWPAAPGPRQIRCTRGRGCPMNAAVPRRGRSCDLPRLSCLRPGLRLPFEREECTEPDRDEVRQDNPGSHT
jgi:hypothetical protein